MGPKVMLSHAYKICTVKFTYKPEVWIYYRQPSGEITKQVIKDPPRRSWDLK